MHKYLNRLLILLPLLAIIIALPAGAAYRDTDGHWGKGAIDEWSSEGIIQGADGFFRPNDPITREQLAVILWRFAEKVGSPGAMLDFADAGEVSDYALPALLWATGEDLFPVEEGLLRPKDLATRAETAQLLMNFLCW